MEKHWERTIPFIKIDDTNIKRLFKGINYYNNIISVEAINEGCRTSNYIIESMNKKYLLKLCYVDKQNSNSEKEVFELIEDKVPIQKIYIKSRLPWNENIEYTIYDYMDGETIAHYISGGNKISETIVKSVALSLANIHKYKFESIGYLDCDLHIDKKILPITLWYEESMGANSQKRLGIELVHKIKNIVKNNEVELLELDKDPRLVHGDFQGNNILIKNELVVGIIDWEFAMAGHPIADIGQFFRYDKYFNDNLIKIFEKEYNRVTEYNLPNNWYKIAKIRDLISLIQLMDVREDMPIKHNEIKELIKKTIDLYL